ncbi:histidinol-phosphate transaminase [Rhodococcus qingshengii]|uniref:histidinol-phosphate transaminase n=1 Tax=Rhodococcus qingshengii TaxID=334542 RepID=UPI001AEF37A9|nr:histidinol-phosphate transaminase [Rhodococcus qingshengii]QTR99653.1 histidinol-phosphate transaminase [Rhodococcus qingshengii]
MSAPGALRPRPRPEIEALPRYSKAAGLEQVRWRASSNESTVAPSAAILEAVNLAASHSHLYPSLFGDTLIARLSGRLGVGDDQVLVGAGSLALLQQVLTAYTGPGTEVVYPWRSYEAYPILIGIAGASGVPVALDSEHRHDLSAMAAAVTPQTRAVLVCNPNNPTGSEFSTAEFVSFARSIPGDVLILLDEAYREFATSDVDGVDLLRAFPNIVVFRTFSKAYGLAGLRAGYAVTNSAIAADLRSAAPPFGLSAVAEAAACTALTDPAHTDSIVETVTAGRSHLREQLALRGVETVPSGANFVWIPLGKRASALEAACVAQGVSVRMFPGEGVRVTVGERAAEDAVIAAVDALAHNL